MNINEFLKLNLLSEANVYNIKLPINGVSIESYLAQQLADITDPTIKPQLTKKLSLLLVNNDNNLMELPNVPNDAPDWAKNAAQAGELYAFIPSENLNDTISNIVHYVQSVITDSHNADNNIVVRAKQELGAIPKVPDLEALYTRANNYFAAGMSKEQKKAKTNTEGMSPIKEYAGWIWYKLDTTEAFEREGKTLQNCIGRHWTQAKAKKEGMQIYILRTEANDSVVAVRSHGLNIKEIKGKNNKPPVEKYMPYVFSFVRDSDLNLSDPSAKQELKNAGYWVFNNKIIVPLDKATNMFYDEETQKLRKLEPDESKTLYNHHCDIYTNPDAVQHLLNITLVSFYTPKCKELYKVNIDGFNLLIPIQKNGEIQSPIHLGAHELGFHRMSTIEKRPMLDFILALGKDKGYSICSRIQQEFKLSSKPPYTPIAELVTLEGYVAGFDKIDTSKLHNYDNWMVKDAQIKGAKGPEVITNSSASYYQHLTGIGINFNRTHKIYRSYDSAGKFVINTVFVDNKNTIFYVQTPNPVLTGNLDKIRNLMRVEHLTVEKNLELSNSNLIVTPPSTLQSKKEAIADRMSQKNVGNKTTLIEFEDGASFKLLAGNELATWLEQAGANTTTDAVYVLMKDNIPKMALPISKKNITGMFSVDTRPNTWQEQQHQRNGTSPQPTNKSLDFEYGPYIKAFAKKMGLSIKTNTLLIKPDSKMEQYLGYAIQNPGGLRSKCLKAAHVATAGAPGINAPYNKLDRPLKQLGLITFAPGTRQGSFTVTATAKGKEVYNKLRNGEIVPMFDLVEKTATLKGGQEEPEPIVQQRQEPQRQEPQRQEQPQQNQEAPARENPRVANVVNHGGRGGSKAQRIYDLFSQMTVANNGTMPARGAFIDLIMQPPYNMTRAGASTYHYNMKTKYQQQHGQLGETFTFKEWLIAMMD